MGQSIRVGRRPGGVSAGSGQVTIPVDLPEFFTALRGYDRRQVDGIVADLRRQVADAHARAVQAERALEAGRGAGASTDAREQRTDADATRRAEQLLARCRQHSEDEASALLASARREAQQILDTARVEADKTRTGLQAERDRLQSEVRELEQRATAAKAQLTALRQSLPAD